MSMLVAAVVVVAAIGAAPCDAVAEPDYFGRDAPKDEITFRLDKSRTTKQRIVLASLFGGAAVFGGVGLLFHLDSNSKSDDVSAVGAHTGRIYDRKVDSLRKDAKRSRVLAIGGYTVGGLFLIAGAVALFVTEPGTEVMKIGDDVEPKPKPVVPVSVVPVRGGVVVGGGWSF